MSIATNLLLFILCINLFLFVFGNPETNSPILGSIKAIYTIASGGSWITFFNSYASISTLTIFGALIAIIALGAIATGANWITTGGGYGSIVTLQILAVAIFVPLILMPNFAPFGFPVMIEYILNIIFGGMIAVTVISLLRGQ